MTEIIIAGAQDDTALEELIKTELSETYRIIYIKNSSITDIGSGYELVFFDCEEPVLQGTDGAVIIAKRDAGLPDNIPQNCTLILNAESTRQLEKAVGCGAYAVDCGHSPQSTVSFTGSSEDTLVVSLNRELTALSGRVIEPLELPVPRHSDDYSIMSFIALRLLLDDYESELGELM